tara:strand:+ start:935 stop:2335 length:1401 start_codon:yes stop_codon:yes gene_type:complete
MKNKFLNDSIIYGLGFVFLRGMSFLLLPIYTNLLSTYDAGIVFIIYTILAFLNPVFSFGMDSALFKFFNSKIFSKNEVISSSLIALFISSTILSSIIITISLLQKKIFNVDYNVLLLISIILFFDSFSSRILIIIRLLEKPWYYLSIGLTNILSSLALNIYFIDYLHLRDKGVVYALLLTSFIQFLISIPIILKNINFYKFKTPLVKKMFLFGIPFFPAAILFIITGMIDRFFINHYLGLAEVGIYGAGYKIGSIISISIIAFNLNWQPYYLKHHEDRMFSSNIKKISQLFSVFLLLIVTLISIGWKLIIKVELFNYTLIGSEFWDSGVIIPWIAFGYYFYGLFILQMPTVYLKNKQLWVPFFWAVAAIINILLNITLIPLMGLIGAGVATLSSYLIMFIFIYIKNQRWMPLNFINKFLIFYFILSLMVVFLVNCYALSNTIQLIAFVVYSAIGLNYLISYKKFLL